jgi:hypothetical protein
MAHRPRAPRLVQASAGVALLGASSLCVLAAFSGVVARDHVPTHQLTARPRSAATFASKVVEVSSGCRSSSAEVENAVSPTDGDVFTDWIGCTAGGISIARSTDHGRTYSRPALLPGSVGPDTRQSWDPAVTVAPDGTLYASFMVQVGSEAYPVVDVSHNEGVTWHISRLLPANDKNWGDRAFVAAGTGGTVYVTWDYGPSLSDLRFICAKNGSCSFSYGDLNIVVQRSTDHGLTWGPLVHVTPDFPAGGADAAPLVVEPNGDIDCVYQALATDPRTYKLRPGHMFFTRSVDGGRTWSAPVRLGPVTRTESLQEWWIDGALAVDRAGDLYATWDTQASHQDIGWLAYSKDHGKSWSRPIRVTPDRDTAPHIVQVAGGPAGRAVIGWLSDSSAEGYALYLRPFSIAKGWLAPVRAVSGGVHGSPAVWPGDTFGISMLRQSAASADQRVVLDWGSTAVERRGPDQIWGRLVAVPA